MTGLVPCTVLAALVGSTATLTAQLYSSTGPNDIFTPVPGAVVTLSPTMTGIVSIGTVANGVTTGLNIPVGTQTRLMFVVTAELTGIASSQNVQGNVSGGVQMASNPPN